MKKLLCFVLVFVFGSCVGVVQGQTMIPTNATVPNSSSAGGVAGVWLNNNTEVVYVFTSGSYSVVFPNPIVADILVIGGGGAGGNYIAGGGGAGGVWYNTSVLVNRGTYSIQVGTGGIPSSSIQAWGGNGGDSWFNNYSYGINYIAYGGGGGGCFSNNYPPASGLSGGSAGGSGSCDTDDKCNYTANATQGKTCSVCPSGMGGNIGVKGKLNALGGGGGGSGGAATNSDGGTGIFLSITGISKCYAGGGGGSYYTANSYGTGNNSCPTAGKGWGDGIYANGDPNLNGAQRPSPHNATDNSGSGGGGGSSTHDCAGNCTDWTPVQQGGYGGSGIVVVRVKYVGCVAGTYLLNGVCTSCGAGFYQDLDMQTSCKSCPAGTYSSGSGSSACTVCPFCYFSQSGASICTLSCGNNTMLPTNATVPNSSIAGGVAGVWLNNNMEVVYIFTSGVYSVVFPNPIVADILVIGGGGAGGSFIAGGGGGGGVWYNTSITKSSGAYSIQVGAGGIPPASNGIGGNGGNSWLYSVKDGSNYTGYGGGGGGNYYFNQTTASGVSGGSAGGSAACYVNNQCVYTAVAIQGKTCSVCPNNLGGNDGVKGLDNFLGGGGGGAGGAANNSNGAAGITLNITGVTRCYAGGGGGAYLTGWPYYGLSFYGTGNNSACSTAGRGWGDGLYGCTNASLNAANRPLPHDGANNSGSGGGGGSFSDDCYGGTCPESPPVQQGGYGGSGIVVIRVKYVGCGPGTYLSGVGASVCTSCGAGFYQDLDMQTSCKLCSAGSYASSLGRSACSLCPVGYTSYNGSSDVSQCWGVICQEGSYCPLNLDIGGSGLVGYYSFGVAKHEEDVTGITGNYAPMTSLAYPSNGPWTGAQVVQQMGAPDWYLGMPNMVFGQNSTMSMCFWFLYASTSNAPFIFYHTFAATSRTAKVFINGDSKLWISIKDQYGNYSSCIWGTPVTTTEWRHICFTINGTVWNLYQNGTLVNTCNYGFTIPDVAWVGNFLYGVQTVYGQLDELRLYKTVLSDVQVANVFNFRSYACGAGTYQDQMNQTGCKSCPAGTYSSGSGVSVCSSCSAGTYSNGTGASASSSCTTCSAGTFSTQMGSTTCSACPLNSTCYASFVLPNAGFSVYSAVNAGNSTTNGTAMLTVGSNSLWMNCPSGTYSTGISKLSPITGGCSISYCNGGATCSTCLPNTCCVWSTNSYYSNMDEFNGISSIYSRSLTSNAGSFEAVDFLAPVYIDTVIFYSIPGNEDVYNSNFSIYIGNVSYNSSLGTKSASYWGSGPWYTYPTTNQQNSLCFHDLGASYNGFRLPLVIRCQMTGRYIYFVAGSAIGVVTTELVILGQPACTLCAAGSYNWNAQANTGCTLCAAGSFVSSTGSTSCGFCGAGTFSSGSGASVCSLCPAGSYSTGLGVSACVDCPAGTYQAEVGASTCRNYTPGFLCTAKSCVYPCGIGRFSTLSAERQYPPKVFDSYSTETTTTFLNKTVIYQNLTLSSAGVTYGTGLYKIWSSSNYAPVPDKYWLFNYIMADQGAYWQDSQYPVNGYYSYSNNIVSGYNGDWIVIYLPEAISLTKFLFSGVNTLVNRAPGLWRMYGSNDGVNFVAIPDASNENVSLDFSDYTGINSDYTKVIPSATPLYQYLGFTVSKIVSTAWLLNFDEWQIFGQGFSGCGNCSSGTYSNGSAASGCQTCPAGTYSVSGASACSLCPAGSYTNSTGYSVCTLCASGTYQTGSGASFCTSCVPGFVTPVGSTNASACVYPCGIGKFSTLSTEREYPSKKFDSYTAETTTTFLNKTVVYQTITLSNINVSYGSGLYKIWRSSAYGSGTDAIFMFDYSLMDGGPHWAYGDYNVSTAYYLYSNYIVDGYYGDWVIIYLPEAISLTKFLFSGRSTVENRAPGLWRMYGSNDGVNFVVIPDASNEIVSLAMTDYKGINSDYTKVIPSVTPLYQYLGFTVNKLAYAQTNLLNFDEWQIFGQGFSGCGNCSSGTYSNDSAASGCQTCPAGTYSGSGASICSLCPAGSYTNGSGASNCSLCGSGTYQTGVGASFCTSCVSGFVSAVGSDAATDCVYSCGAGRFSILSAEREYPPKMLDSYTAETTTTFLNKTVVFQTITLTTTNISYGSGVYNIWRSSNYGSNTDGYILFNYLMIEGGTHWASFLYNKTTGYYLSNNNIVSGYNGDWIVIYLPEAISLTKYLFSARVNISLRSPGLWRMYGSNDGVNFVVIPDASNDLVSIGVENYTGTSMDYTKVVPTATPLYQYLGFTVNKIAGTAVASAYDLLLNFDEWQIFGQGFSGCNNCSSGTYSNDSASTTCGICPVGTFSGSGASACSLCPAGTYSTGSGISVCSSCSSGSYSTGSGLVAVSQCSLCGVGKYSTTSGGSSIGVCLNCPSGSYSTGSAQIAVSQCSLCGVGTYSTASGGVSSGICLNCPSGSYTTGSGLVAVSQCSLCGAGTYSTGVAGPNSGICVKCPSGSYSTGSGQTISSSCSLCGVGVYSTSSGGSSPAICLNCPSGSYSTGSGQVMVTQCSLCGVGVYSTASGGSSSATCLNCLSGTYSTGSGLTISSSCSLCGVGKYSTASGGSSIGVCLNCPSGTYSTGSGLIMVSQCSLCGVGTYSTASGGFSIGICLNCPSGTYSTGSGLIMVSQCNLCGVGFYSTASGGSSIGVCLNCPSGTYSTGSGLVAVSQCSMCGVGTYSTASAGTSSGVCFNCPSGTYSTGSGQIMVTQCSLCGVGKYSTTSGGTNSGICINCPAGTYTTGSGLVAVSQCSLCGVGTYSTASGGIISGICINCPAGTYTTGSSLVMVSQCSLCGVGTYSTASGGTISGICLNCPAGTYSTGSGLVAVSQCSLCGVGVYSTASAGISSGICLNCPSGTYSTGSGLVAVSQCSLCGVGVYSTASAGISSGVCSNCPSGTYSTGFGLTASSSCSLCGAGFYSTSSGGSSIGTCLSCLAGTYSTGSGLVAVSQCSLCNPGKYSTTSGAISSSSCLNCLSGTYSTKSGAVNSNTCQACSIGTYQTAQGASLASDCVNCISNSNTVASGSGSSSLCLCNLGFYGNPGVSCNSCPFGAYADTTNSSSCSACSIFANTSSVASTSSGSCQCKIGYYGSGLICSLCPIGTYGGGGFTCTTCTSNSNTSSTGNTLASQCICNPGYYGDGISGCTICPVNSKCIGGSSIESCPVHASSPAGSTFCICDTGYYSTSCIICEANYYCTNNVKTACYANTTTSAGSLTPCTCVAGMYNTSNFPNCSACPGGKYSLVGSSTCNNCSQGFYSSSSMSTTCTVCVNGTYNLAPGQTGCNTCLANYWCAAGTLNICPLHASSVVGSSSQHACLCDVGYFGDGSIPGTSPCALCWTNYYCPGGNFNQSYTCPYASTSPPGSSTISQCICNDGFIRVNDTCICSANHFCKNGNASLCPGNSTAPAGSTSVYDCKCDMGYYGNGSCDVCPIGSYCPGNTTSPIACTKNATTAGRRSVSALDCFCDRGFKGVNNSNCSVCPIGSWCWTGVENVCPAHSTSVLYSNYMVNCTCIGGYYGPAGGPCYNCPPNSYCVGGTNNYSTSCPINMVSLELSTQVSDCTCVTGYQKINGSCVCNPGFKPYNDSTCVGCPTNTYCLYGVQTSCPGNSVSSIQSTTISDCYCNAGYQRVSDSCISCIAGTYKTGTSNSLVCTQCGAGTYNTNSAQSLCLNCVPGTYSTAIGRNTSCMVCAQNTYSPGLSTPCIGCRGNSSTASNGSSSVSDCKCNSGFYLNSSGSGTCVLCKVCSQYGLTNGNCGWGSVSDMVLCTCNAGYYGDGVGCSACGTCHKNASYVQVCTQNSVKDVTNCSCNTGWYGDGRVCQQCPSGTHTGSNGGAVSVEECVGMSGYFAYTTYAMLVKFEVPNKEYHADTFSSYLQAYVGSRGRVSIVNVSVV